MHLGSLVCGLLISIIQYLMDFLYLQRGLKSRPFPVKYCILGTRLNACTVLCLLYVNPLEKSPPPPPHATIVLLLFTSSIF